MTSKRQSLWPATARPPARRLVLAIFLAPFTISVALSVMAFVLAGMSEQTGEQVIAVTIDSTIALSMLVFGFTATFGLIGIAALWLLGQPGVLAWLVTGLVTGALAAIVFGEMVLGGSTSPFVLIWAVSALFLFMLIRAIAGVHGDPTER